MRNLLYCLCGAALAFSLPAYAADDGTVQPQVAAPGPAKHEITPESLALAHAIIDSAFPPDGRHDLYSGLMLQSAQQAMPSTLEAFEDAGLRRIVKDHIDETLTRVMPILDAFIPLQMDAMANAYAREFDFDELQQINTFAQTPAGKRYLSRSSALLSDPDVAEVTRTFYADLGRLTRSMQPALMEAIRAYYANHPELAPKN